MIAQSNQINVSMGMPGRKTSACKVCAAKKIKCDRSVPECRKCVQKGIRCPGYVDEKADKSRSASPVESTLVILRAHDTLPITKKDHVEGIWSPHLAPNRSDVLDIFDYSVAPYFGLQTTFEDQALPRFFYDWVVPDREDAIGGGFVDFLEEMSETGFMKTPVFRDAIKAVSYASLANQVKAPRLLQASREYYGKTLLNVKDAIEHTDVAAQDETLAAVCMLNLYETIVRDQHHPFQWNAHLRGWLLLLGLRSTEQNETTRGQGMIRYIYSNFQATLLNTNSSYNEAIPVPRRNIPPPGEKEKGLVPAGPLGRPLRAITEFCADTAKLLEDSSTQMVELQQNLSRVEEIEGIVLHWAASIQTQWSYRNVIIPMTERSKGLELAFPNWMDTFQVYFDMRMCAIWNYWRCGRIFMHDLVIQSTRKLLSTPAYANDIRLQKHLFASKKVIADSVNEICATMPCLLNQVSFNSDKIAPGRASPVGGYYIFWPANVIKTKGRLNAQQLDFINKVLVYTRDALGVNQAHVVLDPDAWYYDDPRMCAAAAAASQ